MAQCPIRPVSTVGSGAPVGRRARARQPLACWACLPQEGRCRRVQCGAGRCWGGALGKGNADVAGTSVPAPWGCDQLQLCHQQLHPLAHRVDLARRSWRDAAPNNEHHLQRGGQRLSGCLASGLAARDRCAAPERVERGASRPGPGRALA
ncbi:Pentatricopeptide repeat-containing protein, partial [Durusdinium trenchii]